MTQRDTNPYINSDSNKRYYTYDYYLKKTFGTKCAKIPLDIGLTCPNIDGRCGHGGCIYCSGRGSGDFAEDPSLSVYEQYLKVSKSLSSKWSTDRIIPYFQAHTNTYAPVSFLKEKYYEALALPGVVGMNIATRADCLPPDVLCLLREISEKTVLTVELGLQSVHDKTAELINRGHTMSDFVTGFNSLRKHCPKANICVHLIFGLPNETKEMMLDSVREVSKLHPDQVKLHLLHVIKDTVLADMYYRNEYKPLEREEYIDIVTRAVELLPKDTVVCRLTGDGMGESLISPDWSRRKVSVINDIDKKLFSENTYQGRCFSE